MNPINAAPLHPAEAGSPPAAAPSQTSLAWPGLAAAAREIGVPMDARALEAFARYRELLLARNAIVNLTAIRKPDEIERRLLLDAIAMLPAVDAFVATRPVAPGERIRVIDVGSGAGFPGLALKVARPDLDVTLLDATAKKVAFVNEVISELGIDGARAIHGRAEELGREPRYREHFDVGTARAVAPLPVLLEFVTPFLDIGGTAFLPKGPRIEDELEAGSRAAARLGCEIVSSGPIQSGDTRLVVVRKKTLTAGAYPRRTGVPNQSPLGGGN